MRKYIFFITLALFLPALTQAQSLIDGEETLRGKIIEITDERDMYIPKSEITTKAQFFNVRLKGKEMQGREVAVKYSGVPLKEGKNIILGRVEGVDGQEIFLFRSRDRINLYSILVLLFVLTAFLVIGKKAIRPLASLLAGMLILIFFMVPSLLNAEHIILKGLLLAFALLFVTIVITHGFKRDSYIAFAGIIVGLLVTILITYGAIISGGIYGSTLETTVLLGYIQGTQVSFQHILLLSIMIGMFGILDDIAVTQVSVVRELKYHTTDSMTNKKKIFKSAMQVGRDHASALVNTLFFAYGGILLPAIMFVYASEYPFSLAASQEIFAVEIIRAIAGSIGFLLIIPITTFLATIYSKPGEHILHTHNH